MINDTQFENNMDFYAPKEQKNRYDLFKYGYLHITLTYPLT